MSDRAVIANSTERAAGDAEGLELLDGQVITVLHTEDGARDGICYFWLRAVEEDELSALWEQWQMLIPRQRVLSAEVQSCVAAMGLALPAPLAPPVLWDEQWEGTRKEWELMQLERGQAAGDRRQAERDVLAAARHRVVVASGARAARGDHWIEECCYFTDDEFAANYSPTALTLSVRGGEVWSHPMGTALGALLRQVERAGEQAKTTSIGALAAEVATMTDDHLARRLGEEALGELTYREWRGTLDRARRALLLGLDEARQSGDWAAFADLPINRGAHVRRPDSARWSAERDVRVRAGLTRLHPDLVEDLRIAVAAASHGDGVL